MGIYMHNISFLQNENLPSFAQFCISDSRYEDLRTHFTKKLTGPGNVYSRREIPSPTSALWYPEY